MLGSLSRLALSWNFWFPWHWSKLERLLRDCRENISEPNISLDKAMELVISACANLGYCKMAGRQPKGYLGWGSLCLQGSIWNLSFLPLYFKPKCKCQDYNYNKRKSLSEQYRNHTHQALKDICRFIVDSMLTLNISLSYCRSTITKHSQLVSNVLIQLLIVSLWPSKMFWLGW